MPHSPNTRYAIIGAGIAGVSAAGAIREIDRSGPIFLINGEPVPPYCRPLIVEVLRGERVFEDIRLRDPEWYRREDISLTTGDPAARIDFPARKIQTKSGRVVEWDALLLATGSKPGTPRIQGLETVPASTLYRQEDLDRLGPLARRGSRALLVGMGLVGLQAATTLRELGVEVVAVEQLPRVLPLILDARAAALVAERLEQHGVDVRTGTSVAEISRGSGRHPFVARTGRGRTIRFDFLVLATGMNPERALLDGSGIDVGRGVLVSPGMETNLPGVFAAGDVTECHDWIEGRPEIHAHWVNAYWQGRVAGLKMAGGRPDPWGPVYLNSLDVFGLPVITMGSSRVDEPEGADVYVSDAPARCAYRRLVVKDGRVISATFVNDVERAGVFHFLLRERVEVGALARSLFDGGVEGVEFLDRIHRSAIRGDLDWPESMDRIEKYRKDHRHTRWGSKEGSGRK